LPRYETVRIVNDGDISLKLDFTKTKIEQGPCKITLPEPFSIAPKQTGECVFGFSAFTVQRFYCKIVICTIEQTFTIPVTGVGIKINLSQKSKALLQNEKFRTMVEPSPFYVEPDYYPIDFAVRMLQPDYLTGIEIYELLSIIYQQEESKKQIYADPHQMEFIADKRISFLHENVNIGSTTKRFRSVVETKEPLLLDVTLEENEEPEVPKVEEPVRKSVSFVPQEDTYQSLPDSQSDAEKVYMPSDGERPTSRASNYSTRAQIGDLPPENTIPEPLKPEEKAPVAGNPRKSRVRSKTKSQVHEKKEAFVEQVPNQVTVVDPILELKLQDTNQGLSKILDLLKANYDPFGEPKMEIIEKIASKVINSHLVRRDEGTTSGGIRIRN
jgi:hypothetical protein